MAWYDVFSRMYDRSLEDLYRPYRAQAFGALVLPPQAVVLDVACGTAQNLSAMEQKLLSADATYIGVDPSAGMLRQARRRQTEARTAFLQCYMGDISADTLAASTLSARRPEVVTREDSSGRRDVDVLLCTLGLTVIPDWVAAFDAAWAHLAPGGTALIMDVHAEVRGVQTFLVERIAQADLSREVWRPLEAQGVNFTRTITDAPVGKMGGKLSFATATKPAAAA